MKVHCHCWWWLASTPRGYRGETDDKEIISARSRAVGDGPRALIERIPGGDQEEVTLRAAGRAWGESESEASRRESGDGRT